ncbi:MULTISPECIES: hypothetical protein [Bradyrhizobium]|uniref:hypothetical protein n=1 Tax=Bradyrhizobium TaxID=374 RepID=UPI002010D054|nr:MULTISPECIES: hypothetical protein [Bradyrhizobium]
MSRQADRRVLVVLGWGLTLLPRQARDGEAVCLPSSATRGVAQLSATTISARLTDAVVEDMRLHD